MKYIDAELLREKIAEQMESLPREVGRGAGAITSKGYGMMQAFQIMRSIIDSLQEEQPEVDLVAELKHHLATTPKEQLEKEWKELEPWGNIGPTVQEFLYGKQPEVDLNDFTQKMNDWKIRHGSPYSIPIKATMAFTARMFYTYPNIAREWYESLPKATQD